MAKSRLKKSQRDPSAFADFYRARYEMVVAYFARRVFEPDVALDLTAETFAAAYLSRTRFRGSTEHEETSWLYTLASRKLYHYQRRGNLERKALDRLRIEAPATTSAHHARVSELADLPGLRAELRQGLEQLSQEQREAINLRVVQDLPYADVAASLTISEKAARARVARGLTALAEILETGRT